MAEVDFLLLPIAASMMATSLPAIKKIHVQRNLIRRIRLELNKHTDKIENSIKIIKDSTNVVKFKISRERPQCDQYGKCKCN